MNREDKKYEAVAPLKVTASKGNFNNTKGIVAKKRAKTKTSKFIGVDLYKKKYRARVTFNCETFVLGHFKSELAAAMHYDAFVLEYELERPLNNRGAL